MLWACFDALLNVVLHTSGSQDSKDGLTAKGAGEKPPSMPEETGKSKVALWLTSQGLKKVKDAQIKRALNLKETALMFIILKVNKKKHVTMEPIKQLTHKYPEIQGLGLLEYIIY